LDAGVPAGSWNFVRCRRGIDQRAEAHHHTFFLQHSFMDHTSDRAVLKGKRERTRERIANAGVALFQAQGFDDTTMEQIAVAADVVRGTLYNHFPVKEAVVVHWLHAQLDQALGPLMEQAMRRRTFRRRVGALLDASATWWEQHRDFAAPYIRHRFQEVRESQGDEPSSAMIPAYEELILAGQESGELSRDIPAIRLASYLHFLSLYALLDWLGNPRTPLSRRFSETLDFFLEGARTRGGGNRAR
jgi:TetR/AcrR family transcriptional regulator of autoinduction and epiphytic fitness